MSCCLHSLHALNQQVYKVLTQPFFATWYFYQYFAYTLCTLKTPQSFSDAIQPKFIRHLNFSKSFDIPIPFRYLLSTSSHIKSLVYPYEKNLCRLSRFSVI